MIQLVHPNNFVKLIMFIVLGLGLQIPAVLVMLDQMLLHGELFALTLAQIKLNVIYTLIIVFGLLIIIQTKLVQIIAVVMEFVILHQEFVHVV